MIFLAIIYSFTDNIIRINKFKLQNNYTDTIVPLKKVFYNQRIIDDITINIPKKPNELYCSFSKNLCVSKANDEFITSNFKLKRINNYIFVIK